MIEILFFYHPVVWLISRQSRIERELCCDDVSVSACDTPDIYARALASVSSMQMVPSYPYMTLINGNSSLYYRIKRILKRNTMDRKNYNRLTAAVLILAAVIIVITTTGTGIRYNIASAVSTVVEEAEIMQSQAASYMIPLINSFEQGITGQDTSIIVKDNTVTRTIEHPDGKKENVDMIIKDGTVQELVVDGNHIPENQMDEYQELIDQTMNELQMMEEELRYARRELDGIDFNAIQDELRREGEYLRQEINMEMERVRQELQNIQIELPAIDINLDSLKEEIEREIKDIEIDREQIREEMEMAMEKAREAWEEIDMEQIRREVEEAMEGIDRIDKEDICREIERVRKSIEAINQEQIQQQVHEAIRQIEQIDIQEIQYSVQEAIRDVMDEKEDVEQEKIRIDEMIREIEKLELEDK
jgi:hypothetical protein